MKFNNLNSRYKGILFIILSAFGFAMMSAFVKISGDLPSFEKTFFRNIVSLAVSFLLIIISKESYFGKKENQKILILRASLGTIGIIFNFYSIDKLILSDANMLNKLSPFFVIIFSGLFLKEQVNIKQISAIITAFIGTLFIIKPSFNLDIIPSIAGILGAVTAAAAYTCVRALSGKENPNTIVFYFSFFSSIITFPLMLLYYEPMTLMQLVYLILAGAFACIGQFGITFAYKHAPAKEISIFDYTNIIFSALISLALFGILPDYLSVIGYTIIFISSLYIFLFNKE